MIIHFDQIRAIANAGIQRTVFFLGFGLNAAENREIYDYHLGNIEAIRASAYVLHLMPELNHEQLADAKKTFACWIVTCGLRELIETFALFLDSIHHACLLVAQATKHELDSGPDRLQKDFHDIGGIERKLTLLGERFEIRPSRPDCLHTIARARNCLAHRSGKVGTRDLNEEDAFVARWLAYRLVVKTHIDEYVVDSKEMPFKAPEGASVKIRMAEQQARFQIRERIAFSAQQLLEICWFVSISADEIVAKAVEYAKSRGIEMVPSKTSRQ